MSDLTIFNVNLRKFNQANLIPILIYSSSNFLGYNISPIIQLKEFKPYRTPKNITKNIVLS
jgi:hypothetical protein